MLVVNLFAGEGAGKSTMAAGLFHNLKMKGITCEYATEYAKDCVWENRKDIFSDQLYIIAKQNRKLIRLKDKVECVITDSPLVLGLNYRTPNDYLPSSFEPMVMDLFNSYNNLNFFVIRKKEYNPIGRNGTKEQAEEMDKKIVDFLHSKEILFLAVDGNKDGLKAISDLIYDILLLERERK